MATSLASDFKVYQQQFFGGMTETLQQAVDVMNASSNGAISMTTERMRGDFEQESFFESLATLVSRQDTSSTSPASAVKLTQDEIVRVKLHRKIGPVEVTRKAFLQIGQDPELASFILGQQTAQAVAENMLNSALLAARVSLANTSAVTNDVTGSSVKHTTHKNLINTLRKFGDKQGRIVAWVLHSSNWFDLSVDGVENQIDSVASDIIRVLEVPGMGRPFIVTDSPSLITAGSPDTYYVLGLTSLGIQAVLTEDQYITTEEVTGGEQIVNRIQGEYAFNLGVKGFRWDITNGGANPDDTSLGTGSNWDKAVTSDKDLAGVSCQIETGWSESEGGPEPYAPQIEDPHQADPAMTSENDDHMPESDAEPETQPVTEYQPGAHAVSSVQTDEKMLTV